MLYCVSIVCYYAMQYIISYVNFCVTVHAEALRARGSAIAGLHMAHFQLGSFLIGLGSALLGNKVHIN